MKVLVINQCSTNKGDRAVLFFVLRELARNGISHITVSTSNPEYWEDSPDIPDVAVRFVPWGWDISRRKGVGFLGKVMHLMLKLVLRRRIHFPLVRNALIAGRRPWYLEFLINKKYMQAVKQADVVLSTGGHHITTIIMKNMVTSQVFDMAVALLYNKPLILWSQSIGSFDFKCPKNKLMVQKILSRAGRIFIRDEASAEEILKMGVSLEHVSKTYESVFGLYDVVKSPAKPTDRPPVMGVSVWTGNKPTFEARNHYIGCLAALVNHAIEVGYRVRFFPMELGGSDRPYLEAVINSVDKKENCELLKRFPSTVEHINEISQCRIFVGHKTHSVVFSLTAATPLIAIAYHQKTNDFMAQFGIERHCISETQLNKTWLLENFNEVNSTLDVINQKELEIASMMCARIKKDFAGMIEDVRRGK